MKKIKLNRNIVFFISILLPMPLVLTSIFNGSMPFWFDPARDFLSAIANQNKITLIGQSTGIPGLFYGPYWIWLLSLTLYVSKDPRVVQFLVLGIPYLFIFPLVLYKFKDVFGIKIIIALWLIFSFSFMRYAIFPWNPHLAPFLILIVFYLLVFKDSKKINIVYVFSAGLFSGFVGNFHLSFDIGLVFGSIFYIVFSHFPRITLANIKKMTFEIIAFLFGFSFAFLPFILFELRHGFLQTKTALSTIFSPYAVVGIKGLSADQIINSFIHVPSQLFQIPAEYSGIVFLLIIFSLVFFLLRRTIFTKLEKNLLILTVSVLSFVILVFLKSKNPVWEYHFIGMEISFLLLLGLIGKKISLMGKLFFICAVILASISYYNFILKPRPDILSYDTLAKKEYIVKLINSDAGNRKYSVFVYNPGIYTYDYSYLFKYLVDKELPYDPSIVKTGDKLVYLVIQKTTNPIYDDFVNYRTNNKDYKTTNVWKIADGTQVLKRELK